MTTPYLYLGRSTVELHLGAHLWNNRTEPAPQAGTDRSPLAPRVAGFAFPGARP